MVFIKRSLFFIFILNLLSSCYSNQNESIDDLKIYTHKSESLSIATEICSFKAPLNIKYLNIFAGNSSQTPINQNDNFNLTGIIHVNREFFALIQDKNQSFIIRPNDIVSKRKIANISLEKICIKQASSSFDNNTCIALHKK
jgi:hypothetical protein